jgi:purine-binding chemotaxis protein CheW
MPHQQPDKGHHPPPAPEPASQVAAGLAHPATSQEHLAAVWARRARTLAQPVVTQTIGKTLYLLAFVLGGQRYAVQVSYVREIYPLEQITAVPRAPDFVVGLFSARGRLISVIDLHAFLGLPKVICAEESKLIVVANAELEIALLADHVSDVTTVFEEELEAGASAHMTNLAEFLLGIAPGAVAVLNLPVLLNSKRLIVSEEGL